MKPDRDVASDPRPGDVFAVLHVKIQVTKVVGLDIEYLRYNTKDGALLGKLHSADRLTWADRVGKAISHGDLVMVEEGSDKK